jgi:hypothetical protein
LVSVAVTLTVILPVLVAQLQPAMVRLSSKVKEARRWKKRWPRLHLN